MPILFNTATAENGQVFITAFDAATGQLTPPVDDSHPNFTAILQMCDDYRAGKGVDEATFIELFDIPKTIANKFSRLSDRVTVENDNICFDGDPVQPGLSKQILRFLGEGLPVDPLVNFMEHIMSNPSDNSREQAWAWLNHHDFSVTPAGMVIGYKGVYNAGEGGYCSSHRGHAFVNDVEIVNDYVPNAVGDVVHMPRSEVMDDPHAACHSGLHVGTYNYAKSYAQGAMLRVLINPRDIVSVPHDASGAKIRVCRYRVDAIITEKDDSALVKTGTFDQFAAEDPDAQVELDVTMKCESTRATGDHPLPMGTFVYFNYDGGEYGATRSKGVIASGLDEDNDYWVEHADNGDGQYVHMDLVEVHEDDSEYVAPPTPMTQAQENKANQQASLGVEVGDKVQDTNSRVGTVVSFYRGHRGRKAKVRYGRGRNIKIESHYVSDLTLV